MRCDSLGEPVPSRRKADLVLMPAPYAGRTATALNRLPRKWDPEPFRRVGKAHKHICRLHYQSLMTGIRNVEFGASVSHEDFCSVAIPWSQSQRRRSQASKQGREHILIIDAGNVAIDFGSPETIGIPRKFAFELCMGMSIHSLRWTSFVLSQENIVMNNGEMGDVSGVRMVIFSPYLLRHF